MSQFKHYIKVILLLTVFTLLLSLPLILMFAFSKFLVLLGIDLVVIYFLMPTYKASYHITLDLAKKSIPRTEITSLSLLVFTIYMTAVAKLLVQTASSPLPDAIFSVSVLLYLTLGFVYAEPSTTILDKIEKIVR